MDWEGGYILDGFHFNLFFHNEPAIKYFIVNISVKEILNAELLLLGFHKHNACWYKDCEEIICVVGLQRSQWGKQYYINLAIWIKSIGQAEYPQVRECHIQCRLENILTEKADDLRAALDEEDAWKMDLEERRDILKLGVCNADFLFFLELNTLGKIRNFIQRGPKVNLAVAKAVRDKLNLTD